MASYTLNISFTNKQLGIFEATNSQVIIAKPVGSDSPNVAWQAFSPMQSNQLTWDEEYGIYASTVPITSHGAVLTKQSMVDLPATMQQQYTLKSKGDIDTPVSGGVAGSFYLLNQYSSEPYMTVGLFQDANINGKLVEGHAISAANVLLQSTAQMTPFTTLYVWLASDLVGNCVITSVTSPMTKLKFGGAVSEISVSYDSQSGNFLPLL
jgi:hypothetical protein